MLKSNTKGVPKVITIIPLTKLVSFKQKNPHRSYFVNALINSKYAELFGDNKSSIT